jgi:hypothetical protein
MEILMKSVLLEKYLASQFKFGFELEAIAKMDDDRFSEYADDEAFEEYESESDIFEELAPVIICEDIADAFDLVVTDLEIKEDGSVQSSADEGEYPFEWATPVMDFTPANLKKCIRGLDTLHNWDYYTNETCGFHVHLSFPDISDKDVIWILSKLSIDDQMLNKITNFNGIEFFNDEYAGISFLKTIKQCILDNDYYSISEMMNTTKYRAIRIHPQGTIEWRGPRDFLDDYHIQTVYDFFKLLYEFVKWISNTIVSNDINGVSKENYFQMIYGEGYRVNHLISGFNEKHLKSMLENKMLADIKSEHPSFLIKLVKSYMHQLDETGDRKLLRTIQDCFTIITNENYTEEAKKYMLNLLDIVMDEKNADMYNVLEPFITSETVYSGFVRAADGLEIYKFLVQLFNNYQYGAIRNIMDNYYTTFNIDGLVKFFVDYQLLKDDEYWAFIWYNVGLTLKFSPFVKNAKVISKQSLTKMLGNLIDYYGYDHMKSRDLNEILDVCAENKVFGKVVEECLEALYKTGNEDWQKIIKDLYARIRG